MLFLTALAPLSTHVPSYLWIFFSPIDLVIHLACINSYIARGINFTFSIFIPQLFIFSSHYPPLFPYLCCLSTTAKIRIPAADNNAGTIIDELSAPSGPRHSSPDLPAAITSGKRMLNMSRQNCSTRDFALGFILRTHLWIWTLAGLSVTLRALLKQK